MTDSSTVDDSIRKSIQKFGFPEKVVRLPFKPVFESCKKHGCGLAEVLERLEQEKIFGDIEGNYIVFRSVEKQTEHVAKPAPAEDPGLDPNLMSALGGMPDLSGIGDVQGAMKNAMDKMTPEQMKEIQGQISNMSDADKKNILKVVSELMNRNK